jgi:hypothetical protein
VIFGNSCFANMTIRFLVGIGRTASTETNHEKWSASISARNVGNSNGHTLTEIRREKNLFWTVALNRTREFIQRNKESPRIFGLIYSGREAGIQISQRCREATVKKRRRKLTI